MTQTMKAAVMYGPNDLRVEQVPKPSCAEDGMLINVKGVGLCGSDIRHLTTDSRPGGYPCIFGHEHAGVIAEIGPKTRTDLKVGERVFVSPVLPHEGAHAAMGGFAEYLALSAWNLETSNVLPLPDDVPFENVIITEPLSSVYSCQEAVDVKPGQTVVVIGAGPVGCLHAELARARGAGKVIVLELLDERMKMAEMVNPDHIVRGADVFEGGMEGEPVRTVRELTDGRGADHVISANPSTVAQQQAVFMCAEGGVVTLFGGVPRGALTPLDTNTIHYSSMWLYGHFGFSLDENKKAFDLICSGQIKGERYISRIMPLEEINKAVALAQSGSVLKIVFQP